MTCEFENTHREIKTQIVQNCLSHKFRMKALQNPDLTLTQLLDAGKAMEMSKSQANNIEGKQDVNKLSKKHNTRPISEPNKDGGHVDRKSSTHVKTHKLLQTCKQVVTSLFTSCSQDVFALLVPNLLEQVWNKLFTNCNKLDGTIRPVTRLFQQD